MGDITGNLSNILTYLLHAVDIIIVTFVVYKLIILLRGTRALQLLKGIMVIVVAMLLSSFLQLRTLQWLMDKAFTYGVFAILVIFQPEMRRALEQIGRGRFFSRSANSDRDGTSKVINDITSAAFYMAKRRIGALIVIERESGLNDYIETGIALQSKSSSQLLINIFIPNTPLHDGAVILRKDQVMAAACYLPLSENPAISKELGTRHRAAIGVSEVSDSIALVVSEETGQVSVSMHGEIRRDLSEDALKEFLEEKLNPQTKSTPTIWQRKVKNNG